MAGPVELARRHGLERIAAWEQPSLWPRNAPPVAQEFKQHRGEHCVAVIVQPYLEPYLGGDSFEAVRIGGFDKRCGV
jgi:hypothetical protein